MEEEGLKRSKDFQVWIMAEVPSIALLAEEFAELVDGFSIGSNDLTQLVLGADRDSNILAEMGYFDERDPAVLKSISMIIRGAHKKGKTVSICGQAPSVYPEIVEFLVREGIDSISVNPDAVVATRRLVASIERKIMLERLEKIIEKIDKLNI
jgi:pyruvate,water dikinase